MPQDYPDGAEERIRLTILGIDPGSVVTGIGLVTVDSRKVRLLHAECLRAPVSESFEKRLLYLFNALGKVLDTHRVDEVAIETPFYGVNVQTLMKMCHARGSLLTAVAEHGLPVHEYAPREIKKAVVGNGNASKKQVAYMVQQTFDNAHIVDDLPLDATDAIAAAMCRAHRAGTRLVGGPEASGLSLADRLIAAGAPEDAARRAGGGPR